MSELAPRRYVTVWSEARAPRSLNTLTDSATGLTLAFTLAQLYNLKRCSGAISLRIRAKLDLHAHPLTPGMLYALPPAAVGLTDAQLHLVNDSEITTLT